MKIDQISEDIRSYLIPEPAGLMYYRCLGCAQEYDTDYLLYTCPECGNVLMLHDRNEDRLREIDGSLWRKVFDYRRMLNRQSLKGISTWVKAILPW